ncbi:hypothetical protein MHBO_002792, partial [Bonamia ostreae]
MRNRLSREELIKEGKIPKEHFTFEHDAKKRELEMQMKNQNLRKQLQRRPTIEQVRELG